MRNAGIFLIFAIIISAIPGIVNGDHVIDSSKNPSFLFVLSARSGTFKDGKLTLKDVPLVVYFSDRPDRIAGHLSLEKFVELWGKGPDSFKADPPNATISIFDESGNNDVVLELSNLQLKGNTLTFEVRVLEGNTTKSFGRASLFIDLYFNSHQFR